MAGIIAAVVNNSVGIAGIANCKLHVWKVFSDQPEDDEFYVDMETYLRALNAVIRAGVKVVNLSLGGTASSQTEALLFRRLDREGIAAVAAMGNEYEDGNPTEYPKRSKQPLSNRFYIMVGEMAKIPLHEQYAEGLRYFMGEGRLNNVLARLCADLNRSGIDYMVIGAVALMAHGYARFTEDIDLVLTPEGLQAFHEKLIGLGYVPAFDGARKRLRSTADSVPIEVVTTGEYPGDGKPKPVQFPVPSGASVDIDGVRVVTLEKLVELKLASGMTAPYRLKDLADVQELIKASQLDADFANRLNPYVHDQYLKLWNAVHTARKE